MPARGEGVILAPFSNSEIRDWPVRHWEMLVGHVLAGPLGGEPVFVTGTINQRLRANEIVRRHPSAQVHNLCGRLPWPEVTAALRSARCVVGNNSGVSHLAAQFGRATVCVFGGSHNRMEWGPRGRGVVIVSRAIGCSPCQLDHGGQSPYNKACLREIAPETVAEAMLIAVDRVERASEGAMR